MVGCVYHCTTAVSHDVSNSYKSTLSLFDSKCVVAIFYLFPSYFKLLSCVIAICQHWNSSGVCRTVLGAREKSVPDGGAGLGAHGQDAARPVPAHFTFCGRIQFGHPGRRKVSGSVEI